MKPDGIIFDRDGTLWDSCRVVAASWSETLLQKYGIAPGPDARQIRSIMGMTAAEIQNALFSQYGARAEEICLACIHGENAYIAAHGGDVYAGVPEMLAALSETRPLFIVSNCLAGYIECFLESSGLGEYFMDYACEGATGLSKAGNIALIARRNRLTAPLYVGDTAMDERSAREAGVPFIHAAYGFGTAAAPDAVIQSPRELAEQLETWKGGETNA